MTKTAKAYEALILADILKWYEQVEAPTQLPDYKNLSILMREARVFVDALRERSAKEINKELREEWGEMTGSGVRN